MRKRIGYTLLLLLFLMTICAGTAVFASEEEGIEIVETEPVDESIFEAEPTPTPAPPISQLKKKKGRWVKKKGYYYYCKANGKKLKKGIHEIGGKKYYFDKKGRQRTGWRKVNGHTYFFRLKNGKGGYMIKGKKVNGIRLKKSGRASPQGERARQKLSLLLEVQKITDGIGKPTTPKDKRLKSCYKYIKRHYNAGIVPALGQTEGNWDLNYLQYMLDHGYGDCLCFATIFAYCATAIGYRNVLCVNNTKHCWAEIEKKFYDPHWDKCLGVDCYGCPASLSGVDGRPHWVDGRFIILNCDK